jgi:hypothetical protein
VWITVEKVHPASETLIARQGLREILANLGKGQQMVMFVMLHFVLPTNAAG